MKKTILMLILAAMSTGAMAEWVRSHEFVFADVYVDPSAIQKNGNMTKMWSLSDYRVQQVESFGTFRSSKALHEYDCKFGRVRFLATTHYSEQMGAGKVVGSIELLGDWSHVARGTVGETDWEIACGKIKLK